MENYNIFGLGSDNTDLVGYALNPTDRLGAVSITITNLGLGGGHIADTTPAASDASVEIKQLVDGEYVEFIAPFTVVTGGTKVVPAVIGTKQIGFFGSGNTRISVAIHHPHAAALRGGHIDIVPVGRKGYGFDTSVNREHLFPTPASVD